ncbi:MAG: cytochrome c [Blastocatellia bacterium]|nr:cytochrome c [Blastocatellia bacterium]
MMSKSNPEQHSNPAGRPTEPSRRSRRLLQSLLVAAMLFAFQVSANAQEAPQYFRQNCMSCHTIGGGRLTGPDLKDVSQRKDRVWLARFMLDPKGMIASGDPYAAQLQQEARGVVMPTVSGMSKERADALLDLIEAESKLEKSQFIGLQIPDGPFSEADIALGRDIFLGRARLKNGGPSCVGCHTAIGLPGLGGGRLGPDLSKVFERLESRKTLGSWLLAPPTTTMQPVWRGHPLEAEEILPLVAYFEDVSRRGGEDTSPARLNFFLIGLAGTVAALVGFDLAWRKRFRAVRRPMVRAAALKRGQLR